MKRYIKKFFIYFLFSITISGLCFFIYLKTYKPKIKPINSIEPVIDSADQELDTELGPLEMAVKNSNNINFILLGIENEPRSDVIVFLSFDPDDKKISMISIPRDTYYYEKGYEKGDQRKLNAVFGRSGALGTADAIGEILAGVPIHHYICMKYQTVADIVDILGGVEIDIPFHMDYIDPSDNPPLIIDIPKGRQKLNGEQALKFLRWRQNNDKKIGYPDGDLGRIRAQQKFIKEAIKKSLNSSLPTVIEKVFSDVGTNMTQIEALSYCVKAMEIKVDDIALLLLPGMPEYQKIDDVRWSYYFYDKDKVRDMMLGIYGVEIQKP
ncbi:LCP family protein [Lutispora sp.]|uniref:LCP family protein n=1 Tax=Lutispora sp. TaxID=2828727 RepID=UPI002B1FBEC4|nr:LCP family protein [Lutispora sp.]MEA4960175.1 LCP family protein [Lutispora sp.]